MHKMSANENPFGPSPKALEAMQKALPNLGLYPPQSDKDLREKLAQVHGRGLRAEHFCLANSGCDVLHLAALAFLDDSSSILQCPPAFPLYERTARQQGAGVINVALDSQDFSYKPALIAKALQENTKAVYICNPNNPTGTVFTQEVFDKLLSVIPEHVLLIYDEVYYHFVKTVPLPDALAAVMAEKNILIVHSFSKSYGLAGLRLGYGIAKPELIQKLEAQKNPFHVNALALKAAEAALSDHEHVAKTVANNSEGRHFISKNLQALGLKVWPSEANFVLFEVPKGFSAAALCEKLLDFGVEVRPAFGLREHVRVSVALAEANKAFIAALKVLLS